ncbi:MAG: RDD family protein [Proteobacteria bacterium]|nr:RDD family protein [Pseudomonadota bacterium]
MAAEESLGMKEGGVVGVGEPSLGGHFLLERSIAKLIDLLISGALFFLPGVVGPIAAALYILISDGLSGGHSLGKRIVGLRVVESEDERTLCDLKSSIIRNSIFAGLIAFYLAMRLLPYLGMVIASLAWVALIAVEMCLIYTDGQRLGDRMAGTKVLPEKFEGYSE